MEVVVGRVDEADDLSDAVTVPMKHVGESDGVVGAARFEAVVQLPHAGLTGYTVRVLLSNPLLARWVVGGAGEGRPWRGCRAAGGGMAAKAAFGARVEAPDAAFALVNRRRLAAGAGSGRDDELLARVDQVQGSRCCWPRRCAGTRSRGRRSAWRSPRACRRAGPCRRGAGVAVGAGAAGAGGLLRLLRRDRLLLRGPLGLGDVAVRRPQHGGAVRGHDDDVAVVLQHQVRAGAGGLRGPHDGPVGGASTKLPSACISAVAAPSPRVSESHASPVGPVSTRLPSDCSSNR